MRIFRCNRFHVSRLLAFSLLLGCVYILFSSIKVLIHSSALLRSKDPRFLHDMSDDLVQWALHLRGVSKEGNAGSQSVGDNAADAAEGSWCPAQPPKTDTAVKLKLNQTTFEEVVKEIGHVMQDGGYFRPTACQSRERVAIIVPYRDREANLHILLRNLLPFLWRQMLEFTVFLAQQTAEHPFNKGVLFNAAYRESLRQGNFTCFIMQDVDLLPMDHRNLYRCGQHPRHLCLTSGQTAWKNKLMYPLAFGGAIALRRSHIELVNGFSVSYYGWGLEDDDLALRVKRKRLRIERYNIQIGKYYRLDHNRSAYNPRWNDLKRTLRQRQSTEGLNTLNYTLLAREKTPLFTRLLIRVPPPPPEIYGYPTSSPFPSPLPLR
ncbi:beta-1,4-galactosyltransferase 4-like [Babylonia areolata]|uniref:beta-1,4-galactosyltransferase 4-like n=1 Tax=Babylonia areolata TaxID=304850 RepID=UPI003FCFFE8E